MDAAGDFAYANILGGSSKVYLSLKTISNPSFAYDHVIANFPIKINAGEVIQFYAGCNSGVSSSYGLYLEGYEIDNIQIKENFML
jgi:hypothetical protein